MVETKHMQKTITRNDYARQNRIRSRLPVHCFRFHFGPLHKTEKYPFRSIHRAWTDELTMKNGLILPISIISPHKTNFSICQLFTFVSCFNFVVVVVVHRSFTFSLVYALIKFYAFYELSRMLLAISKFMTWFYCFPAAFWIWCFICTQICNDSAKSGRSFLYEVLRRDR